MRTWKWLALISARRVLPIYDAYVTTLDKNAYNYNFAAPKMYLEAAENVLRGKLEAEEGYDMANGAYEYSDFHYRVSRNPIPFRIYEAAWASSIALLEVSKRDPNPFGILPHIAAHSNGFLGGNNVAKEIRGDSKYIPGEDFTDALWARSGHSDTAAVASTAWSCDENSKISQPQKLLYFWHWWLTDALNKAWDMANKP